MCSLCSRTRPHILTSSTVDLIFCCCCLEIIHNFNNFHFSLGPSRLCSWSCLPQLLSLSALYYVCTLPMLYLFPEEHLQFHTHLCLQGPVQRQVPKRASVTILANAVRPHWNTAVSSNPRYHPMWFSLHMLQEFRERRDGCGWRCPRGPLEDPPLLCCQMSLLG